MAFSLGILHRPVFGEPSIKGRVGIEMMSDGMAIATQDLVSGEIDGITFLADDASSYSREKVLAEFVEEKTLSKRKCNLVLEQSDYQLLLVEAPDVPEEEMREAIRWRVKELINMPLDNAAIDVFMLPADGSRAGKKMVYVVAAAIDKITKLIEMIKESGLELHSIDIKELALRNVSLLKHADDEMDRGMAIARINQGSGCVSIYKQGDLYLSRQFQINYGGGLLDDIPVDNLVLEIQRSLDYYERQMGQALPSTILICGESVSEDKITQEFKLSLPIPIKLLELHEELNLAESVDDSMVQLCVGAIGALNRVEVGF